VAALFPGLTACTDRSKFKSFVSGQSGLQAESLEELVAEVRRRVTAYTGIDGNGLIKRGQRANKGQLLQCERSGLPLARDPKQTVLRRSRASKVDCCFRIALSEKSNLKRHEIWQHRAKDISFA
jgi:hypothetical protein